MPPSAFDTQTRLDRTIRWLTAAVDSLGILCDTFKTPFLQAMCITTRSLLSSVQTVKKNKNECIELMEKIHEVVYVVIDLHVKSGGEELPSTILNQMGEFTETLHKIHTFVDSQQEKSRLKQFFRQSEMSALLKDCTQGLQQALEIFKVHRIHLIPEVINMGKYAQKRHQEVLELIQTLSDTASSDRASSIITGFSGSQNSSNSLSLLPSEPKIFHGRESEVSDVLHLFHREPPRIAILGAGGMGKTSLARAVLHHAEIASRYDQHRFFLACDSVSTKSELVSLIGIHLGIKPEKDLTRNILRHLSSSPASLLILDNLETSWELLEARRNIEGLLSLLADIQHLALIITMRGAERPGNVRWTRPFLPPLEPLSQDAARQTFIDIAEDIHNSSDIDRVLSLTGNMPLAINLLSHMVDTEGCTSILDRWEAERTSLISEGHDRRSNLDLSISLSLSSPRITLVPQSKDLLSLLSMLPDGLSDAELVHSKLPIQDVLGCKAALLRTSLAYNELGRVKTLVPIREYMQKSSPPTPHLIHPLLKQFSQLLQLGSSSPNHELITHFRSNFANIQSILQYSLQQEDAELANTIYSIIHFMVFCRHMGHHQLQITLKDQILPYLPKCNDHQLELRYITALFTMWPQCHTPNSAALIDQALEHLTHISNASVKC
ncbi:P-loop containing nucleoside triphosphate hydrolase protein [Mycena vulgaris]|nr:P-loop containing nucleoside triphosphate hydrolase protein [Mycena vulgaris]